MTLDWQAEIRPSRVRFGAGCLDQLGELVRELGGSRALIVTDGGIRKAGHVDRAIRAIETEGLSCGVFDGVGENPTEEHVAAGVEVARRHGVDFLVGLGGGSAMDCAKGINFVFTNGGRMEDYWGMGRAKSPMLPSIGVPCTAGTGSEAQSFALISRAGDHRKMACGDVKARFQTVLLDRELAVTAPREVVASTGFDAISHAVESYVTSVRNPFSQMMAADAWSRLRCAFPRVLRDPGDQLAWGEMLVGAHLAGAAIECSMLGVAHAAANPLTSGFDIAHGAAIGLMLPPVVRFNAESVGPLYDALIHDSGSSVLTAEGGAVDDLADLLEELRDLSALPRRLRDCGVPEDALGSLAQQAADQWTKNFNPRKVSLEDLEELYRVAF